MRFCDFCNCSAATGRRQPAANPANHQAAARSELAQKTTPGDRVLGRLASVGAAHRRFSVDQWLNRNSAEQNRAQASS